MPWFMEGHVAEGLTIFTKQNLILKISYCEYRQRGHISVTLEAPVYANLPLQ